MNDHAYFLFARPAEALTVPVSPTPRTVPPRNPKPATTAGAAAPQETTSRATPERSILQEHILGQMVMMVQSATFGSKITSDNGGSRDEKGGYGACSIRNLDRAKVAEERGS